MHIQTIIENSTTKYKYPSMLLVTPPSEWKQQVLLPNMGLEILNFPDREILEMFSENKDTNAIVICGSDALDNGEEIRSFIFSARKFFAPKTRPLIIIYTNYFSEEFKNIPAWNGLYCEILQYGNIYLKCGRVLKNRKRLFTNELLGRKISKKSEEVYAYTGHQYE